MSFWKTFISDSKPYKDAEIEDIKFHLTKLLEAEASLTDIDNRLVEVNRSNLKFGIEDIQLLSATLEKTQLTLRIETWIKSFEPRLHDISVELGERKEGDNSLSFNIIAKVKTSYGEQDLIFDSKIALSDLTTSLEEDNYD
ncbi:lysozyme [Vibrio lentus]|uniref:GPW/gp25 family protein n=1 Tax=Vibrio lentus TaxID=136468 RepID=A0A2J6W0F6_9VIBR|nr:MULTISPECIES: GPW/gp25 family protein [Vibrio]OBT01441.1 lysozyme [Vibrio tasmaniensis]PHN87619.1 type VI secretion system baseplate subunit TssE [Vibrio splendidus]MCB5358748.1 GPW/gp25 family protein [Vibrio lentus]MCB5449206.1 GPW/gp25 family protein [Vibrio lentus]MCB5461099.1 GPW/gp25 family protein [Vibrio lentus]